MKSVLSITKGTRWDGNTSLLPLKTSVSWNLATGLTSVGGVQKTKLFYQINFKAKHRDKRFRKDGMQGIKVLKHQTYVALSVLVRA